MAGNVMTVLISYGTVSYIIMCYIIYMICDVCVNRNEIYV